jgi:hypothetical protein
MVMQEGYGQTTEDHPTTQVLVKQEYDYITVVGASYMSLGEHFKEFLGKDARGNKMRFVNQGIRQIRQYPETTKNYSVQRIYLIFIDDYSGPLLKKIKSVVEGRYGASYRELDNISHFVDFINTRLKKERYIRQLDIFSHGVVGSIEFGYALSKEDSYRFRDAQARMLDQKVFEYDAKAYSYVCRTGLGIDVEFSVGKDEDPCYDKSLAQIMADAADVEVWAYPKKSNYDLTYGTAAELRIAAENVTKVKSYDDANRRFKQELREYQKRLALYQKNNDSKAKQLPSESPPVPPPKTFNDEQERLARHEISRQKNIRDIGYPLDEEGALRPVRSGDKPTGLPSGLRQYIPKAWGKN